ncbi:hypothetical protein NKDENANG_03627 [Candidatus Entotheonellaceae bacterium PAL068K]
MLKRLIEVALPIREISEQSAREKSIRHGHISTTHVWWARRPLAACRAVVFASLIPDPDDPECPEAFRKLVQVVLSRGEFRPRDSDGSAALDTPRNRCLAFIEYLVKWENAKNPYYIDPARQLIAAAHKFLHPDSESDSPGVLDPFAGGGAIPLEALRLGCEAHAIDINPVAHLIQLCTLVYPQKYGQPDSRPVPDYIKRLIAFRRSKQVSIDLFDNGESVTTTDNEIIPDVEITEDEYLKNPLAADVKYWGYWVLEKARSQLMAFYPHDRDGNRPLAYLWARTIKCPNPSCRATIPCLRQLWVCNRAKRKVALRLELQKDKTCRFVVLEGDPQSFDPSHGTMQRGNAMCPFCQQVAPVEYVRQESRAGRMGQQLMTVVTEKPGHSGKQYRMATKADLAVYGAATQALCDDKRLHGEAILPGEPIPSEDSRAIPVHLYGLLKWGDLFNDRQALALTTFVRHIREAIARLQALFDAGYARALGAFLAMTLDRLADSSSTLCTYRTRETPEHMFARQALPMVWDYCEVNTIETAAHAWGEHVTWITKTVIEHAKSTTSQPARTHRASAMATPLEDESIDGVITDPPYYDAVPYADLSDFFYVWLKRTVGADYPDLFATPLTPKRQELVSHLSSKGGRRTAPEYETGMQESFKEAHRVLNQDGIASVMFAHKTTTAWERIISGLIHAGLVVTSSWPIHTESPGRLRAQGSAALASSVTLVCRKRTEDAGDGFWDDVRQELRQVAGERLDFFWNQGIRGADFFISAIGPALSVFGKYERVTRLSGEEVTVAQFLDEVRSFVTSYAIAKILKTTQTATIDPESRFYVVWKWAYGNARAPADESFKLAQALGMRTEDLWNRTGVLVKSGENVSAVPIDRRMQVGGLGQPGTDGAPASLVDVLHRLCAFREKGDNPGMAQFLGQSGQAHNPTLWLVAQAISEILPDGEKEKQLMQGLLNQRQGLEEATRELRLF